MDGSEVSIVSIANTMLIDAILGSNSVDEASLAIRLGADVNSLNPVDIIHNGVKRTVGVTPLMGSVTRSGRDPRIVELLLENGADPTYHKATSRTGVIHLAAYSCTPEIINALVRSKLVDVNLPDNDETTPLVYAIKARKPQNMRALLDAGADVNYGGPEGILPVIEATKGNDDHALSILFEYGVNVNVRDSELASPLHYAAMLNNTGIARMLIRKGADLDAMDGNAQTPLLRACFDGNADVAKVLADAGADVNAKDVAGMTPLMLAVKSGDAELAAYLISKSADVRAVDAQGYDALTYAYAKRDNGPLVKLLRDGNEAALQLRRDGISTERRKVK